jgi:thymidylate synthase (FAD)
MEDKVKSPREKVLEIFRKSLNKFELQQEIEEEGPISLQWITPHCETVIMRNARVSSANPNSDNVGLISYLIKHEHWSPFETASMCIQLECSRTIARQILRHRSFSFQEFSQRYQFVDQQNPVHWEARLEHLKNRQSSVPLKDEQKEIQTKFDALQKRVWEESTKAYREALELGIAKEQARCLIPEGLVKTKMCMSGTIRSWIHYIQLRTKEDTQQEHREVAEKVRDILKRECPNIGRFLQPQNPTMSEERASGGILRLRETPTKK